MTSPFASNPVQTGVNGIDVDLNNNDVLIDRGNKIETFSEGTADGTTRTPTRRSSAKECSTNP